MSVTLEEIAKATGFSVPTVSKVLGNSSYPVNVVTRERIKQAAEALGYKPNIAARSLRTEQSNTIGIIVDDILSPFVPSIVRGIQDRLKLADYLCFIVNSDWDPQIEQEAISTLVSRPVDGIIFVEYSHRTINETLERSNKPYVFVHRLFGSAIRNSVIPDEIYGSTQVMKHLIGLGHRRIAYINGVHGWYSAQQRLSGYEQELTVHDISLDPDLIREGDWMEGSGYTATQTLLALNEPPTAIFAANDLMALGAISAILEAGMSVPDDIAVVGYDNRDFTRIVRPRITTMSIPIYEMGRTAAELLLRQMQEGRQDLPEIKVKGQLFIRESCGADESQRTKADVNISTIERRILLHKDPDN